MARYRIGRKALDVIVRHLDHMTGEANATRRSLLLIPTAERPESVNRQLEQLQWVVRGYAYAEYVARQATIQDINDGKATGKLTGADIEQWRRGIRGILIAAKDQCIRDVESSG